MADGVNLNLGEYVFGPVHHFTRSWYFMVRSC